MKQIIFSCLNLGLALILNLQVGYAQKENGIEQFPKGSLVSNIGSFPSAEYVLTSKENILHFSGMFNGVPKFNFGVDESQENQASPEVMKRMIQDAIVFNAVENVTFNNENGEVVEGDVLTVSSTPGVMAKALPGDRFVLGIALESSERNDSGLIASRILFQLQE